MNRRSRWIISAALLSAALVFVAVLIYGCSTKSPAPCMEMSDRGFVSTGGSVVPNDAAYDAMFFKNYGVNPFIDTDDERLSTFGVDVDTGSYTICRRYLDEGHMPVDEAVRTEGVPQLFPLRLQSAEGQAVRDLY